jgi:hypothetical protein
VGKNADDVRDFNLFVPPEQQLSALLQRERDKRGRFKRPAKTQTPPKEYIAMKRTKKRAKQAVNSDLMHEACDRTFVLMESFGEHVCEHPAVLAEPALVKLAGEAFDALFQLYQASGLRMSDLVQAERQQSSGRDSNG